ncbi:MAG: zinc ribbon domain-containing protein [Nitrospinae bacterium]|nr:zinc ribbon domain-containing protein [Nitrospinota bacterium]
MPIYEYRHLTKPDKCKEEFELIETISATPLKNCPECGQPVERMMSRFSAKDNILADNNLKDKGFTKLVRDDEKGGYRKVV